MKTLIILRGLPGAGKTTIVKYLEEKAGQEATVCSADHYFYFGKEHTPENYKFDRALLDKAHGFCKYHCIKAIEENKELIVIDNTNIKLRDFKLYALLGAEAGYTVISHAIVGMSAEDSFKLNVHNVPIEACARMYGAFEKCPRKIIGQKDNSVVEITEIVHDFEWIRKGVFENGHFGKKNSKKNR